MDKTFQAVIAAHKAAPKLTHTQEVQRLYRHSLRLLSSWSESREVFNEEATLVRAEFNANKRHAADSGVTTRLIREARERLHARTHPDPYIAPYMPGGSLFMRNSPPPLAAIFPDGIPEGISRRRVNIDMSNIPDDQEYADTVFVDSVNKVYSINKGVIVGMGRSFALMNGQDAVPGSTSSLHDSTGSSGALSPLSVVIYTLLAFIFLALFNWAGNIYVSWKYPVGIIRLPDDESAEKEPLIERKRSISSDEGL